jgi:hypothetical protein
MQPSAKKPERKLEVHAVDARPESAQRLDRASPERMK